MTPTKDQQAQEYAEKVNYPCPDYGWYESDDKQMKECLKQVWLDGYTACEQSMWRSVEEELPEKDTMVTAHSPNGRIDVLRYHDGEFIDELHQAHCVDYFIPVPPLNIDKS